MTINLEAWEAERIARILELQQFANPDIYPWRDNIVRSIRRQIAKQDAKKDQVYRSKVVEPFYCYVCGKAIPCGAYVYDYGGYMLCENCNTKTRNDERDRQARLEKGGGK